MIDLLLHSCRLFQCLFEGTQEQDTEQDFPQCSYAAYLFEVVDWSALICYRHWLHLKCILYLLLPTLSTFLHLCLIHYLILTSSLLVCGCAPHWIILGTLLLYFLCGDRLAGTTFFSLKCGSVRFV